MNFKRITWNESELMTKETYNQILKSIIRNNEVKDAMDIIEHFNMHLVNEQPQMLKATQVAESIIYSYFIQYKTKTGTLPVPPLGKEFVNKWVKPHELQECDDDGKYCTDT